MKRTLAKVGLYVLYALVIPWNVLRHIFTNYD